MSVQVFSAAFVHATEELLEEYYFHRVSEPLLTMVDEHLLICEACQARLQALHEYVWFVRAALRRGKEDCLDVCDSSTGPGLWSRSLSESFLMEPNCLSPENRTASPLPLPVLLSRLTGIAIAVLIFGLRAVQLFREVL